MKREKCIGNCGRMVLSALGSECRKCKKARLRAGLKNILKVTPTKSRHHALRHRRRDTIV